MVTMFRSRQEAWAAGEKLSQLFPDNDFAAWPDRGYWVLVMRYRDKHGHIRFKFVQPETSLSKKHEFQEKTLGTRGGKFSTPMTSPTEPKSPASPQPKPHRRYA